MKLHEIVETLENGQTLRSTPMGESFFYRASAGHLGPDGELMYRLSRHEQSMRPLEPRYESLMVHHELEHFDHDTLIRLLEHMDAKAPIAEWEKE